MVSNLINVAKAITDPRFSQKFKVFGKSGEWIRGRFEEIEKEISMIGVIAPSKPKEIEMIPEGDRVGGEITIHTIILLMLFKMKNQRMNLKVLQTRLNGKAKDINYIK